MALLSGLKLTYIKFGIDDKVDERPQEYICIDFDIHDEDFDITSGFGECKYIVCHTMGENETEARGARDKATKRLSLLENRDTHKP